MRTMLPLILLSACTTGADEFRGLLPDERLLIETGGLARQARGIGEPSENAMRTLDTAAGINELLGGVLGSIEEVTSFPPSWEPTDRVATWGPWEDDGVEGRLWVRERRDGGYGWAFDFRFTGEEDFRSPIVGRIDAGSTEQRSTGSMLIDAALFDSFGDAVGAQGAVAIEYTIDDEVQTSGSIALDDFAEEAGDVTGDALMSWTTTASDGGSLDFVAISDTSEPVNGTEETVAVRARWSGDGAGRSDGVITGGDAGPLAFYESDCWDASLATVYYENSYEVLREGDAANCAFTDAEYPAE